MATELLFIRLDPGNSIGGHGNPLQYFFLENSIDRGAWQATVHRVTQSDTTEATKQQLPQIPPFSPPWLLNSYSSF